MCITDPSFRILGFTFGGHRICYSAGVRSFTAGIFFLKKQFLLSLLHHFFIKKGKHLVYLRGADS